MVIVMKAEESEFFSPCHWPEVTAWVVELKCVVAACDGCGAVVRGPIAPMFTHGWFCPGCADRLRLPSEAEVAAIAANNSRERRKYGRAGRYPKCSDRQISALQKAWAALRAKGERARQAATSGASR